MAISFDAVGTGSWTSGTSYSYNHTVGAGSNIILWVGVETAFNNIVSGVTYNSVALTQAGSTQVSGGAEPVNNSLWYLINPATGTNSVTVSMSTTPSSGSRSKSASYFGAKQSGVPDASGGNASANTTSLSSSVTTVADNSWVILWGTNNNGSTYTSSNSTKRTTGNGSGIFDTNAPKTPAGSVTFTIDNGGAASCSQSMASFAPSVASANGNFLALM